MVKFKKFSPKETKNSSSRLVILPVVLKIIIEKKIKFIVLIPEVETTHSLKKYLE
ncbi:hypothetical protein BH20BAC1_BH20BAC1_24400 [soil metagenome]